MTAPSAQDVFDVRKIRRLVELMKEHDLSEIDLQQGDVRIQLRRGGLITPTPAAAGGSASGSLPAVATGRLASGTESPSTPQKENIAYIKSPMVGTFYAASDPDSPPFVKVGDHVGPETVVCIVEAMKVFNQIPAEVSGRILAVLVENGVPVEFGQPLFKVEVEG